jgi:hypothetical protein
MNIRFIGIFKISYSSSWLDAWYFLDWKVKKDKKKLNVNCWKSWELNFKPLMKHKISIKMGYY